MAKGEKREPITDTDKNRRIAKWIGWKSIDTPIDKDAYLDHYPGINWVSPGGTSCMYLPRFDLNWFFGPGGPIEKLQDAGYHVEIYCRGEYEVVIHDYRLLEDDPDNVKEYVADEIDNNLAIALRDAVYDVVKEME